MMKRKRDLFRSPLVDLPLFMDVLIYLAKNAAAAARTTAHEADLRGTLIIAVFLIISAGFTIASQTLGALPPPALLALHVTILIGAALACANALPPQKFGEIKRQLLGWWRSVVLGRGVMIRRQDWGASNAPRRGAVDALIEKISEPPDFTPAALPPRLESLRSLAEETATSMRSALWAWVLTACKHGIFCASALLIAVAGLSIVNPFLASAQPLLTPAFNALTFFTAGLVALISVCVIALGVVFTLMRRAQAGLLLVFSGYTLINCATLSATGQCGPALPVAVGIIGLAVTSADIH